jgi:hypothetical protein
MSGWGLLLLGIGKRLLILDGTPYFLSFIESSDEEERSLDWISLMIRGMAIRTDLTPGEHILRCELLEATADPGGGHEFRIISVMRYVPLPPLFAPSLPLFSTHHSFSSIPFL